MVYNFIFSVNAVFFSEILSDFFRNSCQESRKNLIRISEKSIAITENMIPLGIKFTFVELPPPVCEPCFGRFPPKDAKNEPKMVDYS